MEERIGFVGIVVEDRAAVPAVNGILSDFADMIRGRIGIPDPEAGVSVITVIVYGTSDRLGAMTGRLGNLRGVLVKSALTQASVRKGTSL